MKIDKINPIFDGFKYMSPKQVTLACYIKMYRMRHNLSQRQFAKICCLYGEPTNVKFAQKEIDNYERYITIPTYRKSQVLMNVLNITPSML